MEFGEALAHAGEAVAAGSGLRAQAAAVVAHLDLDLRLPVAIDAFTAQADADLKVVKNTLAKIAAVNAGVEGLTELLQGPTAIAYCHGDPVRVAKILQDFIREKKKAAMGRRSPTHRLHAASGEAIQWMPEA